MDTERAHNIWGGARLCARGEHPQKSQLHKTEKKAGCLSAQSHRIACSYRVAGEFVLLGHWETLTKEGKFSFPSQARKETSLGDTGHTRVLGTFWSIITFYQVSHTSFCDWSLSVCLLCGVVTYGC